MSCASKLHPKQSPAVEDALPEASGVTLQSPAFLERRCSRFLHLPQSRTIPRPTPKPTGRPSFRSTCSSSASSHSPTKSRNRTFRSSRSESNISSAHLPPPSNPPETLPSCRSTFPRARTLTRSCARHHSSIERVQSRSKPARQKRNNSVARSYMSCMACLSIRAGPGVGQHIRTPDRECMTSEDTRRKTTGVLSQMMAR